MNIRIRKKEKRWKGLHREIRLLVLSSLRQSKLPTGTISIVLASDDFVRSLNAQYRGQDKPTNVLSFPNISAFADPKDLGDVVLAYETMVAEAAAQNKPMINHCVHLVIHGILHIVGYDHETEDDAAVMEAKEIEMLRSINIENPYND